MRKAFQIGFGRTERELTIEQVPLQGTLSKWLNGHLYRNGPGTFVVGEQHYRHWFDGLAMLHKFTFRQGKLSYRNKFLECKAYTQATENNAIVYQEFATDPNLTGFGKIKSILSPKITDSSKVNIARLGDKYLALSETPTQMEFDPEMLNSLQRFTYDDAAGMHTTTVHPTFDRESHHVYNLVTRFGRISHYRFLSIDKGGTSSLLCEIPVKNPAYLHSFGLSRRYLIFTEFPFVVQPLALLFQLRPFIENYRWKPKRGTRWFIIDRNTGDIVKRFESSAFFAFHHVNAFERDNELVVDLVGYNNPDIINAFYLDTIFNEKASLPGGQFLRFRIDLTGNRPVHEENLSDEWIELPRFDEDNLFTQESYRYVYASSVSREHPQSFYNQLVKLDLSSGESKIWYESHCYPGEPVFVAAPGRAEEDEGVVLSVVLDEKQETSFLLVLDARSFEERARAVLPQPILFGYHGLFVAENAR